MVKDLDNSIISTPSELAEFTTSFIEQFCSRMAFPSAWEILVNRHPKDDINRSPFAAPLYTTLENQRLTIHLYEKDLMGISPLALQGWLDMELARRHLQLETSVYRVNFDKEIRPLINISGSGLQMVRHMVAHLETGLRNLIAAEMIINLRSHEDETMRRRGYEAELAAWKSVEVPLAAVPSSSTWSSGSR